jgi:hypothetical protein
MSMSIGTRASFARRAGATMLLPTVLMASGVSVLLLPTQAAHGGPGRGAKHRREAEVAARDDLLPHVKVVAPDVLEREYTNMRVTPYNDPKFYFELTVPRSFENRPVEVSREQLRADASRPVPMAEFAPRGDRTVLIEARYVRVPENVSLDRFMAVYVEKSGFEFVKRQRGEFEGRRVEDALVRVSSPELGKTLTRLTVSRRGDLIFMVAGSCPAADYPKWKQAFAVAALSFSPTGK